MHSTCMHVDNFCIIMGTVFFGCVNGANNKIWTPVPEGERWKGRPSQR